MDVPFAFSHETSPDGPRILLVDNEVGMLEVCSEALARGLPEGVRLEAVSHPAQGLTLLAERPFDLLVTNLQMPGMSGLTLLQKAHELTPSLPVIVITGYPRARTAERARELGAAGYLAKPFELEAFVEQVQRVLRPKDAQPGADGLTSAP